MRRINYALPFCMMLCVPIASGQRTSAAVPQQVAPTIAVKMIDLVDSTRDPAGKQYRAGLIRPVNIGNGVIIAQGSAATVVLVKNGSGWDVQLSSLVIKGQVTTVTSNPGTVIGAAGQSNVANAANAVLGSFGRKPNTYSPVAVVAMGERVVLTPGISLSFVLNAIPVVPEPSSAPAPVAKPSAPAQNVPAQARTQLGTTYLCWIWTETSYYRSGVFHVAANTSLGAINDAFQNYLRKNYHLQFSGSSCPDLLADPDGQTVIQQIEQWAKAHKQEVISVDWKYVPGRDTPPPPAGAVAGCGVGANCKGLVASTPTPVAKQPAATTADSPLPRGTYRIYCASLTGPVVYVTDKFEVPPFGRGAEGTIEYAFHQFLHEKYSLPTDYQLVPTPCGVDMGVGGRDVT